MHVLLIILASVFLVSLISLVGIFALSLKEKLLAKIQLLLVSGATGTLLGVAFLSLIPEALKIGGSSVLWYALFGVVSFFILERFIFWRHCHDGKCSVHAFTYLNLLGDGVHNFIDGMIIAASYIASIPLGIMTTIAIMSHEIPQEIGDFGILTYGGFSKVKALYFNFISALTSFAGALATFFFFPILESITFLLAFAGGGFIYIASTDLMPELHKEIEIRKSMVQLLFFVIGIGVIWTLIRIFPS